MPGLHSFIEARNQRGPVRPASDGPVASVNAHRQAIASFSRMPVPRINLSNASEGKQEQNSNPGVPNPNHQTNEGQNGNKAPKEIEELQDHHWDGFSTDIEDYTETSRSEGQGRNSGRGLTHIDNSVSHYKSSDRDPRGARHDAFDGGQAGALRDAEGEHSDGEESGCSDEDEDEIREEDPTVTLDLDHQKAVWSTSKQRGTTSFSGKFAERPKSSSTLPSDAGKHADADDREPAYSQPHQGREFQTETRYQERTRDQGPDRKSRQQMNHQGHSNPGMSSVQNSVPPALPMTGNKDAHYRRDNKHISACETYESSQSGEEMGSEKQRPAPMRQAAEKSKSHLDSLDSTSSQTGLAHSVVPEIELDFPPEVLQAMSYEDLKAQSFDNDPHASVPKLPPEHASSSLTSRLGYVATLDMSEQSKFCDSMSTMEWEEAGDWFLEQFSSMLVRMKEARREKRNVAAMFENEIEMRESRVRQKGKDIDKVLYSMRRGGQEVLSGRHT
ncbi:MAG: hypothetical protein M1837_003312 [Sclerophora amabilis]|nr:MAG: hypothetical protein M1837_003312 [Sclerophora amabilis]